MNNLTKKNKLENLNVEPLSLAKYFYEKGVEDIAIIQRLIYLTYVEVLEKENQLLFKEEWQAWSGGPVVESVFYQMRDHKNRKELFKKTLSLTEKNIINYCEKVVKHYQNYVREKAEDKFFQQTRNQPWVIARRNLRHDLEKNKIEIADIIRFNQHKIERI